MFRQRKATKESRLQIRFLTYLSSILLVELSCSQCMNWQVGRSC